MNNIKAKRNLNLGFIVTMGILALMVIIYVVMNSRVAVAKTEIQEQTDDYLTIITKGLTADPVDMKKIRSSLENNQEVEQLIEEITEKQWEKVLPQIEDYYLDQSTMEQHKAAFCDLLKQSYLKGNYVLEISKINKDKQSIKWNLKNQIQTLSVWELELAVETNQDFQFDIYYPEDIGPSMDYFSYNEAKIIWQQKDGAWKIIKADILYPREFVLDYTNYPYGY